MIERFNHLKMARFCQQATTLEFGGMWQLSATRGCGIFTTLAIRTRQLLQSMHRYNLYWLHKKNLLFNPLLRSVPYMTRSAKILILT